MLSLRPLVNDMLQAGAVDGHGWYSVPPTQTLVRHALAALRSQGLAANQGEEDTLWRFTPAGAGRLRLSHTLVAPAPLAVPRIETLADDATAWGCICRLEEDGWQWHRLP
eukprot:2106669-Alexandrium_andersonii.AAC.1